LTFEERLRLKYRSGFDNISGNKDEVLSRKEKAWKQLANKQNLAGKKGPKERYSKLPVSILRPLNLEST
jgi:hypothetical protein